jgi:hypothetical protein
MAFPGTFNFNYYRGDTFDFIIRPKNADGGKFELDGFSIARFTIANQRGPGSPANPRISYNGVAVLNVVEDIVTCTITPTIGRQLSPANTWFYDVEISDVGGVNIFTLLTGTITSTDDVTGAV